MNFNLYILILEDLVRFKVMNDFHQRNLWTLNLFTFLYSTIQRKLTFLEANLKRNASRFFQIYAEGTKSYSTK